MHSCAADFSLEADVVKDMNLSDEGMQKLGELIEQVTAQTETRIARARAAARRGWFVPHRSVMIALENDSFLCDSILLAARISHTLYSLGIPCSC